MIGNIDSDATATACVIATNTDRRDDGGLTLHGGRMMTGQIRTLRVEKGFGFIKDDTGKEYFFHQSAIYGERIEDLREGDSVEFDVGQGAKGPRAENVRRTST